MTSYFLDVIFYTRVQRDKVHLQFEKLPEQLGHHYKRKTKSNRMLFYLLVRLNLYTLRKF